MKNRTEILAEIERLNLALMNSLLAPTIAAAYAAKVEALTWVLKG